MDLNGIITFLIIILLIVFISKKKTAQKTININQYDKYIEYFYTNFKSYNETEIKIINSFSYKSSNLDDKKIKIEILLNDNNKITILIEQKKFIDPDGEVYPYEYVELYYNNDIESAFRIERKFAQYDPFGYLKIKQIEFFKERTLKDLIVRYYKDSFSYKDQFINSQKSLNEKKIKEDKNALYNKKLD